MQSSRGNGKFFDFQGSLTLFTFFVSCTFLFGLASCTFKEYKDNPNSNLDLQNIKPWFVSLNEAVIQPACIHCHNGTDPKAPSFLTYEDVMKEVVANHPEKSQFYLALQGVSGTMPKNEGPLPAAAVQMIYNWIQSGASEYGETPPSDPPESLEPNYPSIFKLIISKRCLGCHTGDAKDGGGLDLSTYTSMTTNFLYDSMIVPGEPQKSDLYIMLTLTDPAKRMPQPKGTPALLPEELSAIETWIKNGGSEK